MLNPGHTKYQPEVIHVFKCLNISLQTNRLRGPQNCVKPSLTEYSTCNSGLTNTSAVSAATHWTRHIPSAIRTFSLLIVIITLRDIPSRFIGEKTGAERN